MKFEDIEIGKNYQIEYIDYNYPCKCKCHSNSSIMHCVPCCYDQSFSGTGICCQKNKDNADFFVSFGRIRVPYTSIMKEIK